MRLMAEKKVKDWKKAKVKALAELIQDYRVVAVSNLSKVRATQIQQLRKKFRGEILLTCAKNLLMSRALKECSGKKPKISDLEKYLQGSNLFIFTNLNPFKLSILLDRSKIRLPARVGDVAQSDIVIPEGNTGIPPGPVISELTEVGIPTRIESGSVWVVRDTVVARKGETIPDKLVGVLSRLGVKPVELALGLAAAYEDGFIYSTDLLTVDLNAVKRELQDAVFFAHNLAVNAVYPTPETLPAILVKAVTQARNLSLSSMIIDKETLPLLLSQCQGQMASLTRKLCEVNPALAS